MAVQGYCVKCKAKQDMQDAEEITMKNGRPAVTGKCPVCGTKMFKIGKMNPDDGAKASDDSGASDDSNDAKEDKE